MCRLEGPPTVHWTWDSLQVQALAKAAGRSQLRVSAQTSGARFRGQRSRGLGLWGAWWAPSSGSNTRELVTQRLRTRRAALSHAVQVLTTTLPSVSDATLNVHMMCGEPCSQVQLKSKDVLRDLFSPRLLRVVPGSLLLDRGPAPLSGLWSRPGGRGPGAAEGIALWTRVCPELASAPRASPKRHSLEGHPGAGRRRCRQDRPQDLVVRAQVAERRAPHP